MGTSAKYRSHASAAGPCSNDNDPSVSATAAGRKKPPFLVAPLHGLAFLVAIAAACLKNVPGRTVRAVVQLQVAMTQELACLASVWCRH